MADQQWSHGNIHPVQIDKEMKNAYIDYAMSVIVMRALPDVRDGLKPDIVVFCTRCTKQA